MDENRLWSGTKPIRFQYRDEGGALTERDVVAQNIFQAGPNVYLRAYCFEREDERTFRIDRIQGDVVDRDTGEIGPLEAFCPFEAEPFLPKKQPARAESGSGSHSENTATRLARAAGRKRPKTPPYGLPVISGTPSLCIEDTTNYRELVDLYFEREERKGLTADILMSHLDAGDIELVLETYQDFLESQLSNERFPNQICHSAIADSVNDPGYLHTAVISADHPAFASDLFRNDGPPGLDDLMTFSADQLKTMSKKHGLKHSGRKRDLCEALLAAEVDLGLRVCRLDLEKAGETHHRMSLLYLREATEAVREMPPLYQSAVWHHVMDEFDLHPEVRDRVAELADSAEVQAGKGKLSQPSAVAGNPKTYPISTKESSFWNQRLSWWHWVVIIVALVVFFRGGL